MARVLETMILTGAHALRLARRDRTVVLLALLFFAMVLVSAYLGWSATATVNAIYLKASLALQSQGKIIPANPVGDTPPLSLFRNMVTYVALLGALAALVLGHQMVAIERKSGAMPLLFSRATQISGIVLGKIAALVIAIAAILLFASVINALMMLLLPGVTLNGAIWAGLLKFYAVSALYMLTFGLMGAASAAHFKSESIALLVPVTVWLTLTFIVPQITANIGPMAALNPLSANIVPPTGSFFALSAAFLGPLSIAESYRYLASSALDIMPGARATITSTSALVTLISVSFGLASLFAFTVWKFDVTRSGYND
jgi:ABC-type transport system involved in multi-copper enzyme maturation permease subunit